jgi:hypothetical protein
MLKKFGLAVLAGTGLAGCTLLYPRFDSLLNPDIAFLNAGEVVDSVKCAVTTFFINHRASIETDARLALRDQLKEPRGEIKDRRAFCPTNATDWTRLEKDPKEWRLVFINRDETDPRAACEPESSVILQANADNTVTVVENGIPHPERISGGDKQKLAQRLADHRLIGPRLRAAGRSGCEPFYHVYKYIRYEKLKDDPKYRGRCVPNGGCRPGTYFQEKGKCGLEDSGKQLVIDPDSSAKIELSLSAVNTGSMNYQRIDATRLDILGGIIVPGGVAGAPFPALKATDKKTNKVEITVLMPQGRVQEDKREGFIGDLAGAVELARELAPSEKPTKRLFMRKLLQPERDQLLSKVAEDLAEDAGEYNERCKSNSLKVGYLGLANYIDRIVNEQETRIYKGPPEVSLDNFVLTSQFQISFDATAGTGNLLRIVPVLQPPVLQLNPDHTHQLKITFKGTKGRRTRAKALSAIRKCLSRLENTVGTQQAAEFCRRPDAILLESLIEAVEDNASTSTGN